MSNPKPIELGKKYKDTISGFEGVATAKYIFLHGCVRYLLEGEMKDDKLQELSFDEQRLVLAETEEKPQPTARRGGPQSESAARRPEPTR